MVTLQQQNERNKMYIAYHNPLISTMVIAGDNNLAIALQYSLDEDNEPSDATVRLPKDWGHFEIFVSAANCDAGLTEELYKEVAEFVFKVYNNFELAELIVNVHK